MQSLVQTVYLALPDKRGVSACSDLCKESLLTSVAVIYTEHAWEGFSFAYILRKTSGQKLHPGKMSY